MAGDARIDGTLSGGGDLAPLAGALLGDTNRIGGRLDIQADLSGTVDHPRAEGTAKITGGRYENILTGTVVRDIGADIRIRNTRLDIVRAQGKAGSGDVTLTGGIDLLPEEGFPLDLALRADKAALVERDEVNATASGGIALKGPVVDLALSGAVTVDTAEIQLVENLPPEVVTLDVTEVNGDGPAPSPTAEEPKKSSDSPIALDLTVSAPGHFFIRGRGLDSEWQGQVKIGGSTASPTVSGQMSPVRGVFSFAGKNFDLDNGSAVAFRDPNTLMPVVDLIAKYSGKALAAQFRLQGPIDDPQLTLSSTPTLPEDEIVSQLLFGRGVSRISAIEAAQLAQALATLSGMGGPSLLDTVRRTLGIDVLRVDAGEGGGSPSVAAGRYLGDGVYIGVNQGANAKSGEARVEVEVTPNITVETEVGPETGGRLGARWKLDY
jgi:translocation and assembly module TamB